MTLKHMLLAFVLLVLTAHAQADTIEYLHTDLLGNVVVVTDENANVIERRSYEPYGLPTAPIADGPGYTGHVHDGASGLIYMQQRYYDPMVGRFLSQDPMAVDPATAWNFNRYNYAANNPYRYTDPDGRVADIILDIGFIAYSAYTLATDPSWTNAAALGADVVGAIVPFATGLGTAVRTAAHGADVVKAAPISGNAQVTRSGGAETAHASTSQRIANEQAMRPDAESVHLNQTVTTITGGETRSAVRPDIATVRQDGKVDVTEVLSPGQDAVASGQKYSDALGDRAGTVSCVPQDQC